MKQTHRVDGTVLWIVLLGLSLVYALCAPPIPNPRDVQKLMQQPRDQHVPY